MNYLRDFALAQLFFLRQILLYLTAEIPAPPETEHPLAQRSPLSAQPPISPQSIPEIQSITAVPVNLSIDAEGSVPAIHGGKCQRHHRLRF